MAPLEYEGISFRAVLTASLGGVFAFLVARASFKTLELDAVWEVAWFIIVSGILANLPGQRLDFRSLALSRAVLSRERSKPLSCGARYTGQKKS